MMYKIKLYFLLLPFIYSVTLFAGSTGRDTLGVVAVADFEIDGKGTNTQWGNTSWENLSQLDSGVAGYDSRFKIMYSPKGIYVLFSGKDKKITSPYHNDFDDLYNADVFEVFFHPKPDNPFYFEYEINAYNKELVLLISNLNGKVMGWRPWNYDDNRKVIKKVNVAEGKGGMQSWTAECFFPYELLLPVLQSLPVKGTYWNANFCRLDYDPGKMIKWSWSPVKNHFHEFQKFQTLLFR